MTQQQGLPILPFDILDIIVQLVTTDTKTLETLTLVSRSVQAIADEYLFLCLFIHDQRTRPHTTLSGITLAQEICTGGSPRVLRWRSHIKHFWFDTTDPTIFEEHVTTVASIIRLCPNLVSLDLQRLPEASLVISPPGLARLTCSFQSFTLEKLLPSSILRTVTTLQPTYVTTDEWPFFINAGLFQRMPLLTQMSLSAHALGRTSLQDSIQYLRDCIPSSLELLIISVPIHVAQQDATVLRLANGTLDRRFVACIPSNLTDGRWEWALVAKIYEDRRKWLNLMVDSEQKDFWEEARDLRDTRNRTLGI
ncbi:hypothetical protein DL96DRAFT_1638205 [Flagelloscypha sp. PMI_526]|nr:hypothetical protein DL96DRAFT_1638205 [Flagelloscypha sp. PMI_526]